MLTFILVLSIIICVLTIAISVWVTNKAYDVLPDVHIIDPIPEKEEKEEKENGKKEKENRRKGK